jgi:hypothetical protein
MYTGVRDTYFACKVSRSHDKTNLRRKTFCVLARP